jgi:anti-sigma factor RsiW
MKPIEHQEISGLIDGQLAPADAERVRQAIAGDETLRAEHEELAALDNDLKAIAATAAFQPHVSLLPSPAGFPFSTPALIAAVLVLRLALKTMPTASGCVIAAGVLALLIWGMVRLVKAQEREWLILSHSDGAAF